MINTFIEILCKELGPTGLLVLGLYFLLYRPLCIMTRTLKTINHELAEIITLIRISQERGKI